MLGWYSLLVWYVHAGFCLVVVGFILLLFYCFGGLIWFCCVLFARCWFLFVVVAFAVFFGRTPFSRQDDPFSPSRGPARCFWACALVFGLGFLVFGVGRGCRLGLNVCVCVCVRVHVSFDVLLFFILCLLFWLYYSASGWFHQGRVASLFYAFPHELHVCFC